MSCDFLRTNFWISQKCSILGQSKHGPLNMNCPFSLENCSTLAMLSSREGYSLTDVSPLNVSRLVSISQFIFLRISSLISAGGSPQLKLGMEFLSWYPNPLCTYLWMRRQMGGLMENQDSADTITSLTSIFLVLRFRNSRILRSQTWNCSTTLSRSDFGPTPGNTNRSQFIQITKLVSGYLPKVDLARISDSACLGGLRPSRSARNSVLLLNGFQPAKTTSQMHCLEWEILLKERSFRITVMIWVEYL